MRAEALRPSAIAAFAVTALALTAAFAAAASDSRAPATEPPRPSWRLVATAPDTGCAVVQRQADVRRLCRDDGFDADVAAELVAVEPTRARFRVGFAGGMPLELSVVRGAPIDLALAHRVREDAAPRLRWVTDAAPDDVGGPERDR